VSRRWFTGTASAYLPTWTEQPPCSGSHETEQVERGLYGPLIVRGANEADVRENPSWTSPAVKSSAGAS